MATRERASMSDIVGRYEEQLLPEWIQHQLASTTLRRDLLTEEDLQSQSRRFLGSLRKVLANGGADQDIRAPAWEETRELLSDIAQARARQGFSPSETAMFVFSLKQPLFERLRAELGTRPGRRSPRRSGRATTLLDSLGLYTTELHQKSREEVDRAASSRRCWSCRRRWSSCGTASSRSR